MKTATESEYVTLGELFPLVQSLRAQLGLPPYKHPGAMCTHLFRRAVPFRTYGPRQTNKLYERTAALRACTELRTPTPSQHRVGTKAEIASREFLPLAECARMLRVGINRLCSMAASYGILAVRHHRPPLGAHKGCRARGLVSHRLLSLPPPAAGRGRAPHCHPPRAPPPVGR